MRAIQVLVGALPRGGGWARCTGEEPYLLFGHKGRVIAVAVSPDEHWIASSSNESISIWLMPDVTKPPPLPPS